MTCLSRPFLKRLLVTIVLMASFSTVAGETLITNAVIVDGTGGSSVIGSVRIAGDRIVAVGALTPREADTVIDAGGLVLAPGFIDTHSHADERILSQRDAGPKITQGITTVVVGQDGSSPYPLATFFAALEETPATVNVAAYAGHNTLRSIVLKEDFKRTANPDQMQVLSGLLREELDAGALGLSTGLEYEPGIYSSSAEVLALAKQTAAQGGRYISHLRSEDRWLQESIEEIIEIGRVTGMPVKISHIKLAMKGLWGTAPNILQILEAARAEGVDITADIYPYIFWQANMMVLLPERDPLDQEAIDFVMQELAPPAGIIFTHFPAQPEYVGKTLVEIAKLRGETPAEAFSKLAQLSIGYEVETGQSGDMIIGTSMNEQDLQALMVWPHANICTDGGLQDRHPRGAGSFPRVLGRYVRDLQLMRLEEGIHKMTGLPAKHLGFTKRGLIKPGYQADLVLLDPKTVADRATTAEPFLSSSGITAVWVNGEAVLHKGAFVSAYPGQVIRRAAAP